MVTEGVAPDQRMEWDASVVGVETDGGSFEVTAEQVLAFAQSLDETSPLSIDEAAAKAAGYRGIVAPPTFTNVFRTKPGLDPKVVYGNSSFHAGQHNEFFLPIQAGDIITAKKKVADVYPKTGRTGTMVFSVSETAFYNQLGELVARISSTNVRRFVERAE